MSLFTDTYCATLAAVFILVAVAILAVGVMFVVAAPVLTKKLSSGLNKIVKPFLALKCVKRHNSSGDFLQYYWSALSWTCFAFLQIANLINLVMIVRYA